MENQCNPERSVEVELRTSLEARLSDDRTQRLAPGTPEPEQTLSRRAILAQTALFGQTIRRSTTSDIRWIRWISRLLVAYFVGIPAALMLRELIKYLYG